ncbi:MAG: hypothetical protein E7081_06890 [Bacteroidales bacterium]|nr:hypothetical protein [Bacteroidales bacterium]
MDLLGMLGLGSIGGGIVVSKLIDYCVPFSRTPQGKLFREQKKWQKEQEEQRMDFQERIESKRMHFQENLEKQREKLQKYLAEQNINNSREIALFQAQATRQTQIMLAQENAHNLLQDHLVQDALKTYPLNVSPLVLLRNRSRSISSLLRFSTRDGDQTTSIEQVFEELKDVRLHPEALNIFVAPVHVDSKIRNREILSKQIWDTVYQRIESFFTQHYNRRGDHPVVFFPTAWSDKSNPGMHASETLHFFLKDVPCVVIEPRFDGSTFRLMFSTWGIGYNSTDHHRTELSFPMNIDIALACAVYDRSLKALDAIEEIDDLLDANAYGFKSKREILKRNIDLFQALHIEQRIQENRLTEIEALGIYNIFAVEPLQDLAPLADYLSAHIGFNLAALADIHHLRSVDVNPLLPNLFKSHFPKLYKNKDLRQSLADEYERSYRFLSQEECELKAIDGIREAQFEVIKKTLELSETSSSEVVERLLRDYARKNYKIEDDNFDKIIEECLYGDCMTLDDIPFFESLLNNMDDTNEKFRWLKRELFQKLFDLQQTK